MYFHVPKDNRNKLEAIGKKGTFVGYCESSKAFRIYLSSQKKIEFSRDVTFDEDVSLGKVGDYLLPAPVEKKDDERDLREGPSVPESEKDIFYDPMERMDPLDSPPSNSPTRKIHLWLCDTLLDAERHAAARGSEPLMLECKRALAFEFEMKDLALMHYYLGLEVSQRPSEILLYQGKYVVKLLERFGMVDCKSLTTPMEMNFKKLCGDATGLDLANSFEYRQLIGALIFLVNTCPNIRFADNTLSQFMTKPLHAHWVAAKHVLRYLHGMINLGLRYTAEDVRLHGYIDVDWAGNVIDRKNTLGCCFILGSTMISWMNKKQKSVTLSMVEA
eukprot:PITA_23968